MVSLVGCSPAVTVCANARGWLRRWRIRVHMLAARSLLDQLLPPNSGSLYRGIPFMA